MDAAFLADAPRLKAICYGAGMIGYFTGGVFVDRDMTRASACATNAEPVAGYIRGVMPFSLRKLGGFAVHAKAGFDRGGHTRHMPGGFQSSTATALASMDSVSITFHVKFFHALRANGRCTPASR